MPLFLVVFALLAVLYLAAARLAMRMRLPLPAIIIAAVCLRVPMFVTQPSLSDDVWRYIHDGRAQHAGVNPFAYAPADRRTEMFRGPEYARINHPHLPTIYPPVAQFGFRVATSFHDPLFAWRLILLGAELVLMLAAARLLRQRGQNPANLALYAWHPLAIIECIGSAHLEPLAIALFLVAMLCLARRAVGAGAAALAASVAAKLITAPLLICFPPKRALRAFLLTLGVLYAPFLTADINVLGSLGTFAGTWAANGSVAVLGVPWFGPRVYRALACIALAAGLLIMKHKRFAADDVAIIYFLGLFALSPVVHPWYLLWVLALLPLRARPFDAVGQTALLWTMTVVLAYSAHHQQLAHGVWTVPPAVLLAEYLPVFGLLVYAAYQKTRPTFSMMNLVPSSRKTAAKM